MRPRAALPAIPAGSAIALATGASCYAQQRERPGRLAAHAVTLVMFAVAVCLYRPK